MKRRGLAVFLSAILLMSAAGCGNTAGKTEGNVENAGSVEENTETGNAAGTDFAADGTDNAANADRTDSATDVDGIASTSDGTGESSGEKEGAEPTAAEWMAQVNTKESVVTDDNYRTWYEVFVYSFYDSDGDGVGDLKGLTEKLDYINDGDGETDTDLGCNGIWLMPVMPSTTYHKYDVTDYCDIDEEYGTLEDFKVLVEECHTRGIDVIIDLVMNHSSSEHEWFQTAAEYLKELPEGEEPDVGLCPEVDYYYFSREGGSGYNLLEGTDWYYESQFWSEMPDLNLGNQAVRTEFEGIVDFWLNLGVDGFRLDAAKEYYSGSVDANVEVLSWFADMVKGKKEDAYIVAEVWNDMETYAKYYESGIDSCFDFDFADSTGIIATALKGGSASNYGKALERVQGLLSSYNENYIDAPFYTNHDMARGAGYYSGDYSENQTKIAQAMNLLMSGSAFLYYGEELGMKGSGKDENKRAPMYWSEDASAAGMCRGPLDMDSVKMKYGALESQSEDGNSIYRFVKETIKLRNSFPEIARGEVVFEENLSDDNVCVIKKIYEGSELCLIYNLSQSEQTVEVSELDLNGKAGSEARLAGMLLTGNAPAELEGGTLTLPEYSVALLQ